MFDNSQFWKKVQGQGANSYTQTASIHLQDFLTGASTVFLKKDGLSVMKLTLLVWVSCLALAAVSARGQGTFQNLDFEAAHNLPPPCGYVAATNALPGWPAFSGTNLLSAIPYNACTALPQVGLYGPDNFNVLLWNGGSISQSGMIPTNAASLLFNGNWSSLTPLGVYLGGRSLSYTAIATGPIYTLYGADISAFAGQTVTLAFSAEAGRNLYAIDNIEFSVQAVPEPATLALVGLAGLFFATRLIRWGAAFKTLSRSVRSGFQEFNIARFTHRELATDKVTGPNPGGPRQFPIRTPLATRVGQFRC
jgi:hypothetical protein